jgi:ADP-ribose pyrophosphatase YjhB (NUDIX family)
MQPQYIKAHHDYRRCINCGKQGHIYKTCPNPLTSYGIILFHILPCKSIEYLMICRRYTFGYVEFVRCTFDITNIEYVKQLISEMTSVERTNLLNTSYTELWGSLWYIQREYDGRYQKDFDRAQSQFQRLLKSDIVREMLVTLDDIAPWKCPEWGFPKGKRNKHETGVMCAKREMTEETNVRDQNFRILRDFNMVTECFRGSDNLIYQHNYYIAQTLSPTLTGWIDENNIMQLREVSDVQWMSFEKCIRSIRPYNLAKKELLTQIHSNLRVYLARQFTLHHKSGSNSVTRKYIAYSSNVNTSHQPVINILDFLKTHTALSVAAYVAQKAACEANRIVKNMETFLQNSLGGADAVPSKIKDATDTRDKEEAVEVDADVDADVEMGKV